MVEGFEPEEEKRGGIARRRGEYRDDARKDSRRIVVSPGNDELRDHGSIFVQTMARSLSPEMGGGEAREPDEGEVLGDVDVEPKGCPLNIS